MKLTKDNFAIIAKAQGYNVTPEFKFCDSRRFKADWLISYEDENIGIERILIEYEGIKGKSRHTSITGYTKDCEKYNLAQKLGYMVLRYTVLNFNDVFKDLEELKNGKTKG